MHRLARIGLTVWWGAVLGCMAAAPQAQVIAQAGAQVQAQQAAPAASAPGLVAFASDEGLRRLAQASAKASFAALANQFEAQLNAAFCGPTSAAIVLNAARSRSTDLPRDQERLRPGDLRHLPPGANPIVPRYTQDLVIEKGQKTRAQVLGEPTLINGKTVRDFGYQLRQFDEMLRANGLRTRLVVVADTQPEADIRTDLATALAQPGQYVIINYRREAVGQQGGGHISPLGAYDAITDSFLVLDVNPGSASWVWMPTATLIKGMRTFDAVENRGYVVVGG